MLSPSGYRVAQVYCCKGIEEHWREMKSYKTVLISALVGAPVGLVFALFHLRDHVPHVTFFMMDSTMKANWGLVRTGILVFVVFGLYWEVAAKSASKAVTSESKASRAVHVTLTNVAFLMEIAPINGLGRFMPAKPSVMMAGIAFEVAGLLIAVWARRHLGKHWSGEITIKEGHELIRTGPYRKLRHPIYTGILTMYVGAFFLTGEWLGVIGLALGFFAYARKIRLEEKNLVAGFGEQYTQYRKDSWAVFPGIW
jgi:protein-S-isoprenylcysteine O-methyltransferase Ste14